MQKCSNNISTILSMYRSFQLLTLSSSPTTDRCTNVSLSQSHTQLPTCQYSYSKSSLSIGRYLNYSFNNCLLHSIQPLCQKVMLQLLRRLPHLLRRLVPASLPPSTARSTPTARPSVPPPTATSAAPFSTPLLCKAAPIVLRRRVVTPSHCIRPDLTSQPNNIS